MHLRRRSEEARRQLDRSQMKDKIAKPALRLVVSQLACDASIDAYPRGAIQQNHIVLADRAVAARWLFPRIGARPSRGSTIMTTARHRR